MEPEPLTDVTIERNDKKITRDGYLKHATPRWKYAFRRKRVQTESGINAEEVLRLGNIQK